MQWAQAQKFDLEAVRKHAKWSSIPSAAIIKRTVLALKNNGIDAELLSDIKNAKSKILSAIPKGVEVLTATSVTLDTLGISSQINDSGKWNAVRPKLMSMDREKEADEMQKLGAAPQWVIGSVHAVTEDGSVVVASNTGSQLPAYTYGAQNVIWVLGAQKIVKNLDEAFKRLQKYTLPLEAERAAAAYGVPGSFISKILVVNQEVVPGRIRMFILSETIGF